MFCSNLFYGKEPNLVKSDEEIQFEVEKIVNDRRENFNGNEFVNLIKWKVNVTCKMQLFYCKFIVF